MGTTPLSPEDQTLGSTAKHAVRDAKRAVAKVLRSKLAEFDVFTFEKSVVRMLHGHGFRELKVAKRSKEGQVLTARRRDGSLELRIAVRVIKGNRPVERRDVQDLRRDLGHYGANMGLICSPGEPRGDAKSEALSGALVMLWCGEGLADKFFEAHVGVSVQSLELYEIDEAFFVKAKLDAEDARARREERHLQKVSDHPLAERDSNEPVAAESAPRAAEHEKAASPVGDDEGDDEGEEGGEEGSPEVAGVAGAAVPGQPGAEGEAGRRRRRRRRGRRGRGPKPEGSPPSAPGAPGAVSAEGAQAAAGPIPEAAATAPTRPVEPPPPPAAPSAPEPGPSGN